MRLFEFPFSIKKSSCLNLMCLASLMPVGGQHLSELKDVEEGCLGRGVDGRWGEEREGKEGEQIVVGM